MAGLAQVAVLLVLLAAAWRPLGDWMARVYTENTRTWLAALAERHDPKGVLRVGQTVRA